MSDHQTEKRWLSYEEVARHVLKRLRDKLGLTTVEGKQHVDGESGTAWEIDAKGIRSTSGRTVIVECRRYTKRLSQEDVAAIAFRIIDTGSEGGIIVSPNPLQKGGATVASSRNIQHVILHPDSTTGDWLAKLNNAFHVGASIRETVSMTVRADATVTDRDGNIVDRSSRRDDG